MVINDHFARTTKRRDRGFTRPPKRPQGHEHRLVRPRGRRLQLVQPGGAGSVSPENAGPTGARAASNRYTCESSSLGSNL
jgi:hypothetical protein